jgi:hypothetical protein
MNEEEIDIFSSPLKPLSFSSAEDEESDSDDNFDEEDEGDGDDDDDDDDDDFDILMDEYKKIVSSADYGCMPWDMTVEQAKALNETRLFRSIQNGEFEELRSHPSSSSSSAHSKILMRRVISYNVFCV